MNCAGYEPLSVERRPVIMILAAGPVPAETVAPLLWGLEEEGVPAELYEAPPGAAPVLAKEAAERSPLNVGIGINLDDLVISLHHRNLPVERPLFTLRNAELQPSLLRRLGKNAARLVKGEPLVLQEKLD